MESWSRSDAQSIMAFLIAFPIPQFSDYPISRSPLSHAIDSSEARTFTL